MNSNDAQWTKGNITKKELKLVQIWSILKNFSVPKMELGTEEFFLIFPIPNFNKNYKFFQSKRLIQF